LTGNIEGGLVQRWVSFSCGYLVHLFF